MDIHEACKSGDVEAIKSYSDDVNLTDKFGASLLHVSVAGGDVEICKILVKKGADVNKTDVMKRTPIMYAAQNGYQDIISFLAVSGATLELKDRFGTSASDIAEANGNIEVYNAALLEENLNKFR